MLNELKIQDVTKEIMLDTLRKSDDLAECNLYDVPEIRKFLESLDNNN